MSIDTITKHRIYLVNENVRLHCNMTVLTIVGSGYEYRRSVSVTAVVQYKHVSIPIHSVLAIL